MEKRAGRPREASLEHAPAGHFFDEFTRTLTFGLEAASGDDALQELAGALMFG